MEELLQDDSFYEFQITNRPIISEFTNVTPDGLGYQKQNS